MARTKKKGKQHGGKDTKKAIDKRRKDVSGLSKMQAEMRRRLDGGKFRMLNEQLYTTTGDQAFQSFQMEPELFDVVSQIQIDKHS